MAESKHCAACLSICLCAAGHAGSAWGQSLHSRFLQQVSIMSNLEPGMAHLQEPGGSGHLAPVVLDGLSLIDDHPVPAHPACTRPPSLFMQLTWPPSNSLCKKKQETYARGAAALYGEVPVRAGDEAWAACALVQSALGLQGRVPEHDIVRRQHDVIARQLARIQQQPPRLRVAAHCPVRRLLCRHACTRF